MGWETALTGKMAEPANPTPKVAMPLMKERRPLDTDADSRSCGFVDIVPVPRARLSNGTILDPRLWSEKVAICHSRRSITEIVVLSIKKRLR